MRTHMAKSAMKCTEFQYEIGIDEAGRGPLFGRVYAAAVILPKTEGDSFKFSDIKDSKKFHSKVKLAKMAEAIKTHSLAWSVCYEEAETIDSINILQATMRAMHNCIRSILKPEMAPENVIVLIDGNYFIPYNYYDETSDTLIPLLHETVLQGDNTYYSIAAASILAKHARDTYVLELCEANPSLKDNYGIHKNMGYGTKQHMEGIEKYGLTEWHRKSFRNPATKKLN